MVMSVFSGQTETELTVGRKNGIVEAFDYSTSSVVRRCRLPSSVRAVAVVANETDGTLDIFDIEYICTI